MDINKKIEEIRNMPEHVRLRYVWGSVIVCMSVIFLIWIFSIKTIFQKNKNEEQNKNLPDISQQIQTMKETAPSLKDFASNTPKDSANENAVPNTTYSEGINAPNTNQSIAGTDTQNTERQ